MMYYINSVRGISMTKQHRFKQTLVPPVLFVFLLLNVILLMGYGLAGCTNGSNFIQSTGQSGELSGDQSEEQGMAPSESPVVETEIDFTKIKPNEAGRIMVLMYHGISEPEAEWVRTPDNLRKDLQVLYDQGYRPISLKDYVSGNITTEAGYTPVVLTFDDGLQNNFELIKNAQGEWELNPNCAVAILEEFHREHPDFPLEATFFINNNTPFGQPEHVAYKLQYIVDKGMDLGNHTNTHVNFSTADASRIQKEIVGVVKMVGEYLPDYEINTLALPFGSRPKDKELYTYLEQGSYEGTSYKNIAILNVGWDPDKSPYHQDFNPFAIHRIRASEIQKYVQHVGMYDWLEKFDKGSLTRFVSDGDADTVTVPEDYKEQLAEQKIGKRTLKTYELEE
jgi:peptidoglycan/xylan/chitin deacetylase (PgdA/CDA1 family)